MKNKIKVVWVTLFSNQEVRDCINFRKFDLFSWIRKFSKGSRYFDEARWITNSIEELKKIEEVELHVISHHEGLIKDMNFCKDGIYYHFFKTEDDNLFCQIRKRTCDYFPSYDNNAAKIERIINYINPQLIHVIGAENPIYCKWLYNYKPKVPVILSLQTLMCDPDFLKGYPISLHKYNIRSKIERKIIQKSDYIGTTVTHYRNIIKSTIKLDAQFLDISLALTEPIKILDCTKEYDFVYFALNIDKAADWAIEAFACAKKTHKDITLLIVGGYNQAYKNFLDKRIGELQISDSIKFRGKMHTHEDVIKEIQKAKFAILPLKVDIITGTIREAMSCGLPVVSTITPGTPKLNKNRLSVLLSEKGDFEGLGYHMASLVKNPNLAETIRNNALLTMSERKNNGMVMKAWVKNYKNILNISE